MSDFIHMLRGELDKRNIDSYCREDGDEPMMGVIYCIVAVALRSHENGRLAASRLEEAFLHSEIEDGTFNEFIRLAAPFIEGGIAYAAEQLGLLDGR